MFVVYLVWKYNKMSSLNLFINNEFVLSQNYDVNKKYIDILVQVKTAFLTQIKTFKFNISLFGYEDFYIAKIM